MQFTIILLCMHNKIIKRHKKAPTNVEAILKKSCDLLDDHTAYDSIRTISDVHCVHAWSAIADI